MAVDKVSAFFFYNISLNSEQRLVTKPSRKLLQSDPHYVSYQYHALDTECDKQATVIGRLLITLCDAGRAVVKYF